MVDPEVSLEHLINVFEGAVLVAGHGDVGREDRLLIREAPQVEVVDLLNFRELHHGVEDILRVDILRRGLHQETHAGLEDTNGRHYDQNGKEERECRIHKGQSGVLADKRGGCDEAGAG